jgi:hypothetical protein
VKKAIAFLFSGILATWCPATARTPDGQTPAEETVCDGETGAAFGLCNAYCEAMDCDSPAHRASDTACSQVRRNFERKTGRPLPCEVVCPCGIHFPLFEAIGEGTVPVDRCIADDEIISVSTLDGAFAIVNGLVQPPFCSVNLEPPFIELTQGEVVACRDFLRRATEEQGVVCEHPE